MQAQLVGRIAKLARQTTEHRERFLADLIRIRSYTGQEAHAVARTLEALRAIGCDDVWMDSAGNAPGTIGHGPRVLLYDAHLDTNEVADEREWPHPPLEPVVEGDVMYGLGASDCKSGVAAIVYGTAILAELRRELPEVRRLLHEVTVVVMGATQEEDAEGFALRSLVERDGLRPEVVLLAEAADLTLRRGQRGRCDDTRTHRRSLGPCRPAAPGRKRYPEDAAGDLSVGGHEPRLARPPDLRPRQPGRVADRRPPHTQFGPRMVRGG